MLKIVTAARTVAEDPAVDGFGHHNPQLGQEDNLFYNTLSINRFMEGFFRGRVLSTNKAQFFCLMRMGILDGREGYDMPMTASTRAMRHTAVVSARLLTLNYARGMRRRERGVKVQGATSCAGRRESLVVLEVRGRGWDR